MQLPLKFLITERFVRKEGTSIVFIQYNYTSKKHPSLNTKIEIPPEFWNKKLDCLKSELPERYGSAEELNLE